MLRNNYRSRNLIGHYPFWVISPRNSTSFTRPFLAGRRARAGHETKPMYGRVTRPLLDFSERGLGTRLSADRFQYGIRHATESDPPLTEKVIRTTEMHGVNRVKTNFSPFQVFLRLFRKTTTLALSAWSAILSRDQSSSTHFHACDTLVSWLDPTQLMTHPRCLETLLELVDTKNI